MLVLEYMTCQEHH